MNNNENNTHNDVNNTKKYDFIVATENFHCWPLSIFWGGEYRYFITIYTIYNVSLTIYNALYVLS